MDSVWVSEHIVIPRKQVTPYAGTASGEFPLPPDTPFLDSLSTLLFVAGCTERVQLGTSVCILPWRNPVITAKELATLDVLSNGRLVFGVGAGWWAEQFAMLGVPFEHRGSRLNEYIQLLKALWTEENPSFHGRFWQIEDVGFSPKPGPRGPPAHLGGRRRRGGLPAGGPPGRRLARRLQPTGIGSPTSTPASRPTPARLAATPSRWA